MTAKTGRPQAIPPTAYQEVFQLRSLGMGFRKIATALEAKGIFTSRSSVERLVRGQPPYPTN